MVVCGDLAQGSHEKGGRLSFRNVCTEVRWNVSSHDIGVMLQLRVESEILKLVARVNGVRFIDQDYVFSVVFLGEDHIDEQVWSDV